MEAPFRDDDSSTAPAVSSVRARSAGTAGGSRLRAVSSAALGEAATVEGVATMLAPGDAPTAVGASRWCPGSRSPDQVSRPVGRYRHSWRRRPPLPRLPRRAGAAHPRSTRCHDAEPRFWSSGTRGPGPARARTITGWDSPRLGSPTATGGHPRGIRASDEKPRRPRRTDLIDARALGVLPEQFDPDGE